MDRRRFLATVAAGSALATGGCGESTDRDPTAGRQQRTDPGTGQAGSEAPTARGTPSATAVPLARQGKPPTICRERVHSDPGIYAVTDPAFADDWSAVDPDSQYLSTVGTPAETGGLADDHTVVGLTGEWGARAYPLHVLWYHEVVNDDPAGDGSTPVMVTFCPLCNSGLVARRVVDGDPTTFVVSGLLWKAPAIQAAVTEKNGSVFGAERSGGATEARNNGNLVMYDRATGSYWSQILATAICGPMTGTDLEVVPSTVATWAGWREAHPGTDVLLPPPHSGTVEPGAVDPGTPPGAT